MRGGARNAYSTERSAASLRPALIRRRAGLVGVGPANAVAVAALAVYDMIKAVDPAARIDDIRLLRKEGGKTGTWTGSP